MRGMLTAAGQWGLPEFSLVLQQFSFLLLDACFAPLLLLLAATQIRFSPVRQAYREDDLCSPYLCFRTYKAILFGSALLVLDVISAPGAAVVLCTVYRGGPIVCIWKNDTLWHNSINFHWAVIINFMCLIHDLLLGLCSSFVYLLGVYYRTGRIYTVFWGQRLVLTQAAHEQAAPNQEQQSAHERGAGGDRDIPSDPSIQSTVPQAVPVSPVSYPSPDPVVARPTGPELVPFNGPVVSLFSTTPTGSAELQPTQQSVSDSIDEFIWPDPTWRALLWLEVVGFLMDLPCVPVAAVVVLTGWRSLVLIESVRQHMKLTTPQFNDFTFPAPYDTHTFGPDTMKREMIVRYRIILEFVRLVRDVLCLVPLTVLTVTAFRLPGIIADLRSKLAAEALEGEPLLHVKECAFEFPDNGGPTITLLVSVPSPRASGDEEQGGGSVAGGVATRESIVTAGLSCEGDSLNDVHITIHDSDGNWDHSDSPQEVAGAASIGISTGDRFNTRSPPLAPRTQSNAEQSPRTQSNAALSPRTQSNAAQSPRTQSNTEQSPLFSVVPDECANLHLLGVNFWQRASDVFGGGAVSVGKAMLPVHLTDNSGIWMTQLNEDLALHWENGHGGTESTVELRMRLDFGKIKRTTIKKKLAKFSTNDFMVIQVEATVDFNISSRNVGQDVTQAARTFESAQAAQRQRQVLIRVCPTVGELLSCVEPGRSVLPATALSGTPTRYADHVQSCSTNKDTGVFVNSFHVIVLVAFLQLLLDFAHIIMVALVMCVPWRGIALLVALFEEAWSLPIHVGSKCLRMLGHGEGMLLDYKRSLSPVLQEFCKGAVSSLDGQDLDGQGVARRDRPYYMLYHTVPRMQKVCAEIDKQHLSAYQSVTKRVLKTLDSFEGCESLYTLFQERLQIHHALIYFWLLRLSASLDLSDDNFPPHSYGTSSNHHILRIERVECSL